MAAIADAEQVQVQAGGGLDQNLFAQLKELRKKVAKNMAFHLTRFHGSKFGRYDSAISISVDEIAKVYGVGEGKAKNTEKNLQNSSRNM